MKILKKNLIVSYACHVNSIKELKLIEHNLSIISKNCNMIFVTYSVSSNIVNKFKVNDIFLLFETKIYNVKIYGHVKNEGYDFYKHLINIKKIRQSNIYDDYILMMNDSVTITNIDSYNKSMLKVLQFINENYDFIGFLESFESKIKHYQSWFWCFNKNTINYVIIEIEKKCKLCKKKIDFINLIELEVSNNLIKNKNKKCISLYNFNVEYNLFYHHSDIFLDALKNKFPFIKKNMNKENTDIINFLPKNIIEYFI